MLSFGASIADDKINRDINELLLAKESTLSISEKLKLDEKIVKEKRFAILFVNSRKTNFKEFSKLYDLTDKEKLKFSKLSKQFDKLSDCLFDRYSQNNMLEPEPYLG